jgi:hypothetical protein
MKTKCYSVRVDACVRISEKAYKVRSFDGSEDIIPASQVFGPDYDVQKCEAYWIAAWILPKKSIQWSDKKEAWFDENGNRLPDYTIERHHPEKVKAKENNEINQLKK